MINLGLLVIVGFLLLILLGAPVYVALSAPPIAYILYTGTSIAFISQHMVQKINSYTLIAIPLFIYVGSLMNRSQTTDRIFEFTNHLIGQRRGGLAYVNIFVSLIFSGMSGAALADIGGIGQIMIDSMKENGYTGEYSAALTSASATVGPIFPPSIPLIIFGISAEVSIAKLLLAGILPAILTVILLFIGTIYIARKKNLPKHHKKSSLQEIIFSFITAIPAIITPLILILGILSGTFGPTEAAAVTIAYILVINTVFYREFKFSYIWNATKDAISTTASISIIIAGASLFSWVLTVEQINTLFQTALLSISDDPLVILLFVNIFLLILGLFIESIAAMLMAIPIVVPPLTSMGINPIQIGVIVVFNLMLGLLTPPLGLSLFLSSDIAGVSVRKVIKEMAPYYIILIISLLIITYVPEISLLLT